jgi:uncharacterized membrane protein YdjX (TVP38/TMEM64 family)
VTRSRDDGGPARTASTTFGGRHAVPLLAFLCLAALTAAWHYGPLAHWLDLARLAAAGARIAALPGAPAVVIGVYVAAGFVAVPINILIAATMLVFGPLHGMLYAYCGVLVSTALTYAAARRLGMLLPASFTARRVEPLRACIARRGWPAVFVVRVLPVAPFTVINTIAGASRIPLRTFLVGTALGMAPGIAGMAFFAESILDAIRHPTPAALMVLAAIGVVLFVLVALARRLAAQHSG